MDAEDGCIWVYGLGKDGVMAFTDFGIETLTELIGMYKETPDGSVVDYKPHLRPTPNGYFSG